MFEPVFSFIEKLIDQFSWRRFIAFILGLVMLMSAFIVYENYTGHFRLSRLDKTVEVIAKVSALSSYETEQSKKSLSNATQFVAEELELFSSGGSTPFSINSSYLKIISAIFPWVIFTIIMLLARTSDMGLVVIGVVALCIPAIIISYFLPLYEAVWINYFAFPFGYMAVAVIATTVWQKRKKP